MKEELKRVLEKAQKEGKSVGVFLKSPPGFYSGKVLKVTDEGFGPRRVFSYFFPTSKSLCSRGRIVQRGGITHLFYSE